MTQFEIYKRIAELELEIEDILIREVMPLPGVDFGVIVKREIETREAEIKELRKKLI